MATIRLAPDAILALSNLSGVVTSIDDDPDAADGLWLTAADVGTATSVRTSFPSPGGDVTGTQEFRAQVRKAGGTGTPTCRIELWENGALVSAGTDVSITSTTGQVISFSWANTLLADITGASVEARVVSVAVGGSPSKKATVEVGAVEWNAVYTVVAPAKVGSVAISGGGIVASVGQSARLGSAALSSGGVVLAAGQAARFGSVAVSGGGVVTATGTQLIEKFGAVAISAGGVVTAQGRKAVAAIASISSGGLAIATGLKSALGSVAIASGGRVSASGVSQRLAQVSISGGGLVTATGFRVAVSSSGPRMGAMMMGVGR